MTMSERPSVRAGGLGALVLVMLLSASLSRGTDAPLGTAAGPCAECHEAEAKQWAESAHAGAVDAEFLAEWQSEGRKWECLVCHASRYDRKTATYSSHGITCESCHGVIRANHPAEERMILPVTSEVCQSCHAVTFGEWRVSAHGQKNIRCFDCHRMHRMELRKDDPDQLCGTCHTERLHDFARATHRIKGLHCMTCHMPVPPGSGPKITGTGVRTHTYGVGGETCSQCHREMVHGGSQLTTLKEEVARLQESDPVELSRRVAELESEGAETRTSLESTKRVFMWIVPAVFLLGAGSGAALIRLRPRRGRAAGSSSEPGGGP